jgi:hypothetical protein
MCIQCLGHFSPLSYLPAHYIKFLFWFSWRFSVLLSENHIKLQCFLLFFIVFVYTFVYFKYIYMVQCDNLIYIHSVCWSNQGSLLKIKMPLFYFPVVLDIFLYFVIFQKRWTTFYHYDSSENCQENIAGLVNSSSLLKNKVLFR